MREIVADRFVAFGGAWIDLATGSPVRLHCGRVEPVSAEILWNDQCAERARLRHPLLNVLVDYGPLSCGGTFEAYNIRDPVRVSGAAAPALLQHAGSFLQSHGLPLSAEISRVALRDVMGLPGTRLGQRVGTAVRLANDRPLGLVLQPRAILEGLADAIEVAAPGGATSIEIAGGRGSGIRTARLFAARTARVAGFVPIASSVLIRLPWVRDYLKDRHLCVFIEDHSTDDRAALAVFLSQLGTASARRHILLRFSRTEVPGPAARRIDSMGITAMTSMVFVDGDKGPSHDELFDAARGAGGRPGLFLERLRASQLSDDVARMVIVHESSPAYVLDAPVSTHGRRGIGRVLRDAPERGARLASRGRHAAAARLLSRASRVLEARGEPAVAAACAEQLAWIERDRGHSDRALDQFERARALAGQAGSSPATTAAGISAVVGIGVVWTDEQRFAEAEASLRAATAAAELLARVDLRHRAGCALARCLLWQSRYEEAAVMLEALVATMPAEGAGSVEALTLLARARVALGDLRSALAAAGRAATGAGRLGVPRLQAAACRAMAMAQRLVGDSEEVRRWTERAVRSAASAHLPLAGLRARCVYLTGSAVAGSARDSRWLGHLRAALTRRPLPALLRLRIEEVSAKAEQTVDAGTQASGADRALMDLEVLLEIAHRAADDVASLDAVAQFVCDRLRASSVQIATGPTEPRTLARVGRPWQIDPALVARVMASGPCQSGAHRAPASSVEPRQAVEPIRFGQETIAVVGCRWTIDAVVDGARASALLRAASLAVSSAVRSLLERPAVVLPDAGFSDLLGSSEAASALRAAVVRAARAPFPVLVEGESGSGKELVARGVHRLGPRRDRKLCTVNCAALSDELLESELFGHARGAFTGSVGERAGLFEEADGGTIFLDEVGELSPRAQAKLLRVLQDGEVRRVGENMPRRVDARLVAATNRRLDDEVAANRFRADLRFRLDVVRIVVPPLRERATDIPALATHFWTEAAARVTTSATLTAETLSTLARYDWPGNIRELQNVLASLAVHAPRRGRITPAALPAHIARSGASAATTFEAARHEFERRFVRAALARAGGQQSRAARTLGLSRQGLAKMMRRLGMTARDPIGG